MDAEVSEKANARELAAGTPALQPRFPRRVALSVGVSPARGRPLPHALAGVKSPAARRPRRQTRARGAARVFMLVRQHVGRLATAAAHLAADFSAAQKGFLQYSHQMVVSSALYCRTDTFLAIFQL